MSWRLQAAAEITTPPVLQCVALCPRLTPLAATRCSDTVTSLI